MRKCRMAQHSQGNGRPEYTTVSSRRLVVDALGLVCVNTMAPGLVLRYTLSPATVEDKAKKPKWILEPEIIRSFTSLNTSQSTSSKPKKTVKHKAALSPVKVLQSPKRAKGKGKGKSVEPDSPLQASSHAESSKKREAPPLSLPDAAHTKDSILIAQGSFETAMHEKWW